MKLIPYFAVLSAFVGVDGRTQSIWLGSPVKNGSLTMIKCMRMLNIQTNVKASLGCMWKSDMRKCLNDVSENMRQDKTNAQMCLSKMLTTNQSENFEATTPQMADEFGKESWPALTLDHQRQEFGELIEFEDGLKMYYVSAKKRTSRVIVVAHDVFGFYGSRSFSLVDQLSQDINAHVILPDFYRNDTIDNHGGIMNGLGKQQMDWIRTFPGESVTRDYEFFIDWLRHNQKIRRTDKIAMVGYCWGGWVTMLLSNPEKTKYPLALGVDYHPSPIVESLFGRSEEEFLGKIQAPQIVFTAGGDPENIKPGGSLELLLKGKNLGVDSEFYVYEEMTHGWVLRGDLEIENVRRDTKDALSKGIAYLQENL